MTRIKDVLTKTILPSTIGAIVLIACFFVDDRLTARPDFESCNDYYLSNSDYLTFILIVAGLGSIFKFTTDRILANRFKSTQRHIISIMIIASLFLTLFLGAAMVNGKFPENIFIEVTLVL